MFGAMQEIEPMFSLSPAELRGLTDLAQALVQTPSISGRESAVASLLGDALVQAGFQEVWTDRIGNVIGHYGAGNGPKLLFDGHMDTIDVGDRSAWQRSPFGGDIENGVLYGRGAVDMKSSLAAMIYGARMLIGSGTPLGGDLYLAFVVQQEPTEGMAVRTLIEEEGLQPDYVVLGEPSDLRLCLGHRGRVELSVATHGKACHAAVPDQGVNAINAAARIVFGIELLTPQLLTDPLLGQGSAAVTQVSSTSGSANSIPDRCTMLVDRRLTLGETEARAIAEIQQIVRREGVSADVVIAAYEVTSYTGYVCRGRKSFPPWLIAEKDPLVRASLRAVEHVTGERARFDMSPFSTDGAYTMGVMGIPTVILGPGDPRYAHTVEEQIRLADVAEAAQVYAQLAVELLPVR